MSREGVQRDILPIVEGSDGEHAYGIVDTDHILFIAAGAFHMSKPSDLIPELQGRFPLRVELEPLTREDFVQHPDRAAQRPDPAVRGAAADRRGGAGLHHRRGGGSPRSPRGQQRAENIGARRLHTIMELLLEEVSFDAPSRAGQELVIDAEYVHAQLADVVKDEDLSRYIL